MHRAYLRVDGAPAHGAERPATGERDLAALFVSHPPSDPVSIGVSHGTQRHRDERRTAVGRRLHLRHDPAQAKGRSLAEIEGEVNFLPRRRGELRGERDFGRSRSETLDVGPLSPKSTAVRGEA